MPSYLSSHWLWAAQHCARLAAQVEDVHDGPSRHDVRHRAAVLASIQASIAFLEAAVNELYQDAVDGHGTTGDGYLSPLPEAAVKTMAELWRGTDSEKSMNILAKYQLMLASAGSQPLDHSAIPYQDVAAAIRLRNALVHYHPETLWTHAIHKLESQLRGRFPDNVLMVGAGNPWWPDHCLGYGCAQWVINSVRALSGEVLGRLGVTAYFERLGDPLFGEDP